MSEGCSVHTGHDDGLGYDLGVLFSLRFVGEVVGFFLPEIHILVYEMEQIVTVRLGGVTQVNDSNVVSVVFLCDLAVVSVQVALGIGCYKAHSRRTGVFEIGVQEVCCLTDTRSTDHERVNVAGIYKCGRACCC